MRVFARLCGKSDAGSRGIVGKVKVRIDCPVTVATNSHFSLYAGIATPQLEQAMREQTGSDWAPFRVVRLSDIELVVDSLASAGPKGLEEVRSMEVPVLMKLVGFCRLAAFSKRTSPSGVLACAALYFVLLSYGPVNLVDSIESSTTYSFIDTVKNVVQSKVCFVDYNADVLAYVCGRLGNGMAQGNTNAKKRKSLDADGAAIEVGEDESVIAAEKPKRARPAKNTGNWLGELLEEEEDEGTKAFASPACHFFVENNELMDSLRSRKPLALMNKEELLHAATIANHFELDMSCYRLSHVELFASWFMTFSSSKSAIILSGIHTVLGGLLTLFLQKLPVHECTFVWQMLELTVERCNGQVIALQEVLASTIVLICKNIVAQPRSLIVPLIVNLTRCLLKCWPENAIHLLPVLSQHLMLGVDLSSRLQRQAVSFCSYNLALGRFATTAVHRARASEYLEFLGKLSRQDSDRHRLLSVDAACLFLTDFLLKRCSVGVGLVVRDVEFLPAQSLLAAIELCMLLLTLRSNDKCSLVRTRALAAFNEVYSWLGAQKKVVSPGVNTLLLDFLRGVWSPLHLDLLKDLSPSLSIQCVERINDDRPAVRREALLLYCVLVRLQTNPGPELLRDEWFLLLHRLSDKSWQIRHFVMRKLTERLQTDYEIRERFIDNFETNVVSYVRNMFPFSISGDKMEKTLVVDCVLNQLIFGPDPNLTKAFISNIPAEELVRYMSEILKEVLRPTLPGVKISTKIEKFCAILKDDPQWEHGWYVMGTMMSLAPISDISNDFILSALKDVGTSAEMTAGVIFAAAARIGDWTVPQQQELVAGIANILKNGTVMNQSFIKQALQLLQRYDSGRDALSDILSRSADTVITAASQIPDIQVPSGLVCGALFVVRACDVPPKGVNSMQLVAAIQNLVSLASGKESAIPAHAVLTLGKISLRDDRVMTRSVGILGRELRTCSNSSVRSNIVVMLCDLVMAYPLRFDQHLIWFSIAARDPDANVRFAAISAISRLLSLDFIKMKLHIFAVLLLAAVGPINQIAALAERTLMEALGSQLNQQLPSMTLNAMFIISGEDLVGVTRSLSVELLGVLVESSHDTRCRALKLAVGHMSEEQKLSFASAVTNEIIVPVSENCLFMSRAERCLLDTIVLLAHILSTRRRRAALSNELRGELNVSSKKGMHPKALEATMLSWEKVISNIVGERLVPAFAELKVVLESNKSPVQRDFMHLFLQLLDDYPEPVRRALALMPDLLSFLEYHRQRPNGRRVAHAV